MQLTDAAHAMGSGGGVGTGGGDLSFIIMMAILFFIFYFLIIRPQQKKQKDVRDMLSSLAYGDQVITTGGIHGKITGLTDTVVTIEIADKVRVKVSRNFIGDVLQKSSKE